MFNDDIPLGVVRAWVEENLAGGCECPACGQRAKIYPRSLYASLALVMIRAYQTAGRDEFHQPTTVRTTGGDYAKLRWWKLVEDLHERREDGGRAGWWRVTALGEAWVLGRVGVPRTVLVYNNQMRGVDETREQTWMIQDALGTKFNYAELMRPVVI